jgi:hypothetical protein
MGWQCRGAVLFKSGTVEVGPPEHRARHEVTGTRQLTQNVMISLRSIPGGAIPMFRCPKEVTVQVGKQEPCDSRYIQAAGRSPRCTLTRTTLP